MVNLKIKMAFLFSLMLLSSCGLSEIDNYDSPNATVEGGIYDKQTGDLMQQDIIRGMEIEYIEQGFDNPQIQYMIVKNDGTYQNKLMFANTYSMKPVRGNFVPIEAQEVVIKGNTVLNFDVQPYIRVKTVKIEKLGTKIVATFTIQQTIAKNVRKIGLFAHMEPTVGEPFHTASVQQNINNLVNENTQFKLEMDVSNPTSFNPGKQYYFRVGALIDVSEAKFNYAPAVRIAL